LKDWGEMLLNDDYFNNYKIVQTIEILIAIKEILNYRPYHRSLFII